MYVAERSGFTPPPTLAARPRALWSVSQSAPGRTWYTPLAPALLISNLTRMSCFLRHALCLLHVLYIHNNNAVQMNTYELVASDGVRIPTLQSRH